MTDDYHVKLSNGLVYPLVGYGTWQATDVEQLKSALRVALDTGYRYIDTASLYQNEHIIGEVLQEYYDSGKLKRKDLFIVSKLPSQGHHKEDVEYFINDTLKKLRTEYLDMYLIHNACPMQKNPDMTPKWINHGLSAPDSVPHIETWRELEKHYNKGTLKSIGISNFSIKQLQDLYDQATVKPQNLQIELHVYHRRREIVDLCRKLNISVTSYATLGSPGRLEDFRKLDPTRQWPSRDLLHHPLVVELAKKYNKTSAQILLRHLVHLKIGVIPKSLTPERVRENFNIFDFKLTDAEVKRFDDEINEDVKFFLYTHIVNNPFFPPYEPYHGTPKL